MPLAIDWFFQVCYLELCFRIMQFIISKWPILRLLRPRLPRWGPVLWSWKKITCLGPGNWSWWALITHATWSNQAGCSQLSMCFEKTTIVVLAPSGPKNILQKKKKHEQKNMLYKHRRMYCRRVEKVAFRTSEVRWFTEQLQHNIMQYPPIMVAGRAWRLSLHKTRRPC